MHTLLIALCITFVLLIARIIYLAPPIIKELKYRAARAAADAQETKLAEMLSRARVRV